jgi:hypothetical protein
LDELEDTGGFPKLKSGSGKGGVRSGESIGMKPGRTGVKGVIRDRNEMEDIERERRGRRNKELNDKMESMNLGGMTFDEEKAFEDREMKRRLAEEDWEETKRARRALRSGKFGHLREVGMSNFVSAVEDEARGVWVVVHIYDQVSVSSIPILILSCSLLTLSSDIRPLYHPRCNLKHPSTLTSLHQVPPYSRRCTRIRHPVRFNSQPQPRSRRR